MNVPYLLVFFLAAGVASFSVVDVIYFERLGYDIAFITTMVSIFNIAVVVAELPFAILFDKYSIKATLYAGFVLRIFAFWIFSANYGASFFIIAQMFAGIATAATSGTTVALVLNEVKERSYKDMTLEKGRLVFISGAGSIIGGMMGALCFSQHPWWIWYSAIAFFICVIITIIFFRDKPAEDEDESFAVLFTSWLHIFRFRSTYLVVLCNASAIGPIILWQLKFDTVSLWFVVIGFFIVTTSTAIGSRLSTGLNMQQKSIPYVAAFNIVAAISFAYSAHPWMTAITFALHVVAHVMLSIQLEGLFHSNVDNKIRASASSIISLSDSLLVAACAPLVGLLADVYGVAPAIAVSAALYLLILTLSVIKISPYFMRGSK